MTPNSTSSDHQDVSTTADLKAVERFCTGCNCSQAVVSVYAVRYGIDPALAMRLATGLGGGIGRMGGTCGTLAGAALVLGLEYGPSEPDPAAKDRVYAKSRALQQRFIDRHGSNQCRDLLGFDLAEDAGYQGARDAGVFKERCPSFVATAVRLLDELLQPEAAQETRS
ncbi:C-GCAxxG-C-C family protein [Thiorhodovibrio frisius]|uniref:C_GCAxxG_C_C family probable redox protein n=1 Tax=Thiorhodovibrio frisius TaxID=631362 RepID=H8Z7H3_9GAMM|nr:C-GCAxxG-C-C family protein [Thiorhodovibrio frisius]EIC20903.1 C_GCAxxG_C_C family probable redox protein [Thiorhodovibrio frisius]WPL21960.1 C_GCAxxG_C_C family protein [Thiorhodovibrio frisius]